MYASFQCIRSAFGENFGDMHKKIPTCDDAGIRCVTSLGFEPRTL